MLYLREYAHSAKIGPMGVGPTATLAPQEPGVDQSPLAIEEGPQASAPFGDQTVLVLLSSADAFHFKVVGADSDEQATTSLLRLPAGVYSIGVADGYKLVAVLADKIPGSPGIESPVPPLRMSTADRRAEFIDPPIPPAPPPGSPPGVWPAEGESDAVR